MRMVQRKLADKPGIPADHVISKKGSSPSTNQDNENKGAADLKKTMEKSRTIQHSDVESLRSTPPLRSKDFHIPKPGKPLTSDPVKTRGATPQRQSLEGSPNYMKSTSSFEARRECSQVSSQTPQNIMIRKSMSPMKSNNSRRGSGSDHKPVGASSLKVARTLIQTPSFKPARALTKRHLPIALCEDFDVKKPTCSSTLKDSKMPTYLELSAGATESEGTSAMKVCPYTYCSLNGHHHDPLPPLKSFLSAKRRMLKAQKVIKLGCLSPHRAKPSRERMVKIDAKQVILAEIPPTKGMEFDSKPVIPLMHEKQTDFFIEIYRNNRDNDTAKGKIPEHLSSTASGSVIDFESNLEADKDQNVEEGAKIHPISQKDEILDCLSTQRSTDEEGQQISQYRQSDFEASEMELKEVYHCKPSLIDVSNVSLEVTDIYNGPNIESKSDAVDNINNNYEDILTDEVQVGFYDERSVSSSEWSDDGDSDLDVSYHNIDLEKPYFTGNEQIQGKIYSTSDGNPESVDTRARENSLSHPIEEFQEKSVGKSNVPEASTGENAGNCESVETQVKENSISQPMEESHSTSVEKSEVPEASDETPEMNFQLESDAITCTSDVEEVVSGLQGNDAAKQEHVNCLLYQDLIEQDQDETQKNYCPTFNNLEVLELDSTSEIRSSDDVMNECFLVDTEDEDADQEEHDEKVSAIDARDGMEEKEPLAAESFDEIRTSDSSRENKQEKPIADATEGMERNEELFAGQHFVRSQPFESLQEFPERIALNSDQSKQTDVTIASETNQSHEDETLLYESSGVENHEDPEINQDQLQAYESKSSQSQDQMHSGPAVLKETPNQNQETDMGEDENRTEPDAAETSIVGKALATSQKRDHISTANRTSNEEMTPIAKQLSWTFGSRKTVAELEDVRDFNPREPNFLPEEPEVDPEKVDLRHQLMEERKNSEEWMVDYALRQAVTKLSPARNKRVSLLVEAFEKVLPTPKYETHPSHTSSDFIHARTIQTCR